jgi:hypothetical protein
MFFYTEHPLKHRMGLSFQYDSPLEVIIVPGQRGFLIFWNEKHLFMSPNSGEYVPLQARMGLARILSQVPTANPSGP